MVRVLRLDRRDKGPWTNFEAYLLKKQNEHVGWIHWIDNTTFELWKNPYIPNPKSPYIYIIPEDMTVLRDEGLICVEPESIAKKFKLPRKKLYGEYTEQ